MISSKVVMNFNLPINTKMSILATNSYDHLIFIHITPLDSKTKHTLGFQHFSCALAFVQCGYCPNEAGGRSIANSAAHQAGHFQRRLVRYPPKLQI